MTHAVLFAVLLHFLGSPAASGSRSVLPPAETVLREIATEARMKALAGEEGEVRIIALHRIGKLHVGEVSLVIGVGAAHREQAYGASRYVLEEIKTRLPVWKKEHYDSGEAEWLKGHPLG